MNRIVTLVAAAGVLFVTAPTVLARSHAYYTVVCDDGNTYESVDARAVEQGHKDDAVVNFSENAPLGLACWLEGPFTQ